MQFGVCKFFFVQLCISSWTKFTCAYTVPKFAYLVRDKKGTQNRVGYSKKVASRHGLTSDDDSPAHVTVNSSTENKTIQTSSIPQIRDLQTTPVEFRLGIEEISLPTHQTRLHLNTPIPWTPSLGIVYLYAYRAGKSSLIPPVGPASEYYSNKSRPSFTRS